MSLDIRRILSPQGGTMQIRNALVEEVFNGNNTTGYILISYRNRASGRSVINYLRLNVNRNTVILDSAGRGMCICDIQNGMRIDAIFSSAMTRSIPPQSNAFLILVRSRRQPETNVTTARIASIDLDTNSLYTGNPNNINTQTRFIVTDTTSIRGRNGNPIRLSQLRPGQMVRIIHANFQTASIPPQTTAFYIQVV